MQIFRRAAGALQLSGNPLFTVPAELDEDAAFGCPMSARGHVVDNSAAHSPPFSDKSRGYRTPPDSFRIWNNDDTSQEFKFPEDSPFRWEALLRENLRRAYRAAGRGEIVEFQPRIVTE